MPERPLRRTVRCLGRFVTSVAAAIADATAFMAMVALRSASGSWSRESGGRSCAVPGEGDLMAASQTMAPPRATPANPMPGVTEDRSIPATEGRNLPPELGTQAVAILEGRSFMYSKIGR